MLLHLGTGGHGDRSTKFFRGHKYCYDGQWPLIDLYFKRYITFVKFYKKLTYVCVSGAKKYQFFGKFCVRTKWIISCENPENDVIRNLLLLLPALSFPRKVDTGPNPMIWVVSKIQSIILSKPTKRCLSFSIFLNLKIYFYP